eukprot:TRINITY_DN597_c0_g1_i2.p1 TRINITY_DN597_c0_g1~~TRINITY_DN597_c0_g1_i2.p1  ORF type:complete len:232 (-),score=13.96 TRINITY_DN597_c0_g1_i2:109-711(-)
MFAWLFGIFVGAMMTPAASQNYMVCSSIWNSIIKNEQGNMAECMEAYMQQTDYTEKAQCAGLMCVGKLLVKYGPHCARFKKRICLTVNHHAQSITGLDCSRICYQPTQVDFVALRPASNDVKSFVSAHGSMFAVASTIGDKNSTLLVSNQAAQTRGLAKYSKRIVAVLAVVSAGVIVALGMSCQQVKHRELPYALLGSSE